MPREHDRNGHELCRSVEPDEWLHCYEDRNGHAQYQIGAENG